MPNRRDFLTFANATLWATATLWSGLPGLTGRAFAQSPADASAFVKSIGDQLVAVVNGPGSDSAKRDKLTTVIDSGVDVDGVARFCLGRFWRNASPEQQKRYTDLFHQVLVNNITAKLGEYQGVRFTIGHTQHRDDTDVVSTVVARPNNPPTNVDWIISSASGSPKIIDVVAEGTSLRLTQRSDYASYLSHNNDNIDALISAMRQQVGQAG
ncbi:MAG TPA: ABC transporter substrate-binding protein [Acetobacteraceae bacterium]|jgi:phospholipid transport system substrate-binding protein|nr:ABC transporter substrate-binding protein [Acetobacteraceae bacterium]